MDSAERIEQSAEHGERSPCRASGCEREGLDKNLCAPECKRLHAWQRGRVRSLEAGGRVARTYEHRVHV